MKVVRFISQHEYDTLISVGEVKPIDTFKDWSWKKRLFAFPLEAYNIKDYTKVKDYLSSEFNIEYDYMVTIVPNGYFYRTLAPYDKKMVDKTIGKELNFNVDKHAYDSPVYVVPEVRLDTYTKDEVVDITPLNRLKESTKKKVESMLDMNLIKKISKATPSEYADIIIDLYDQGYDKAADLLKNVLSSYNHIQNILRYGGSKEERKKHEEDFDRYMVELGLLIFDNISDGTIVSSMVYKKFNQTLNKTLSVFKESKKEIDFQPTDGMVKAAQRGLDLRKEFGRGGTEVGVARARDIVNRKNLSAQTVKRMYSFFSRHGAQKTKGWKPGEENYPSAQFIAWLLWGGDPGFSWATKKRNQLEKQEESLKTLLEPIIEAQDIDEVLLEAEVQKSIIFSSDPFQYFGSTKNIVQNYLDNNEMTMEEALESMDEYDLEKYAIEDAYDILNHIYEDEQEYYLKNINQKYFSFKGIHNSEEFIEADLEKWFHDYTWNSRSLNEVTAYLANGRLVFEFLSGNANYPDVYIFTAYNAKKPVRITID